MIGFLMSNFGGGIRIEKESAPARICNAYDDGTLSIRQCSLRKFAQDKAFHDEEAFFCLLDGVVLNSAALKEQYGVDSMDALMHAMYEALGETFFDAFRGSFSGLYYDKRKREMLVFTNHYGDGFLFYSYQNGNIVAASRLRTVVACLRQAHAACTLNEAAIYDMLTYGYMSDEKTYAQEVQRLLPGHYLKLRLAENGKVAALEDRCYWRVQNGVIDLLAASEDEIIDELDRRFRDAVALEYDKDKECGCRHLTQLSGGLDSRMSLWIARELGYENILCMSFEQSGSLDQQIATQIADDLGVEIFLWPLDSTRHIQHIDAYTQLNDGQAIYSGIGAEYEMLSVLDMEQFGLVHTGQIGDVVIGSFLANAGQLHDMSSGGEYSRFFSVPKNHFSDEYEYREQMLMMVRAFLGCLSSHLYTQEFSYVASPFLNKELFEFCMSVPAEQRIGHAFYKKWILKKHPKAAAYKWEKINAKITQSPLEHQLQRVQRGLKEPRRILYHLHLADFRPGNRALTGMNPYDLWWQTKPQLRSCYDTYFKDALPRMDHHENLQQQLKHMYEAGTTIDKNLVLTALGAVKNLGL